MEWGGERRRKSGEGMDEEQGSRGGNDSVNKEGEDTLVGCI